MVRPASHPFIIGIGGGSGSGKTTVAKNIIKAIGTNKVVYIAHDDYYRDRSTLSQAERAVVNYDHPQEFETELLVKQLKELLDGKTIQKPTYDYTDHVRSAKSESIQPAQVIIVEGILVLESPDLRKIFDLKIYVDTDSDVRLIRRIDRDMKERNREFDFIVDQYLKIVRPMYLQFIEPSKRYADIIIPHGGQNTMALDLVLAKVREIIG
jgi:uridine kinase